MPDKTISVYLPEGLTQWIEEQAKKENRSVSNYIVTVLMDRKEQDDQ